ncbi:MAG: 30S ribosomal protein S8 [Kiritimatiellaeota bacterium]|nr:30S ribosomal protein S8 [Kiritimatiellota bacterium]
MINDPIADMLTRIRNAQMAKLEIVEMPGSRVKHEIARILKDEGFISEYETEGAPKQVLGIALKYTDDGAGVIRGLRRESTPGLRKFCGCDDIPRVLGGLGVAILSTSQGVMSGREARRRKIGGELMCTVW